MKTAPATQRTAPSPRFTSVRITNNGSDPYIDAYDGQQFVIPSKGEAFVPFDAMCLWLGDPGTVDLSNAPSDRHRTSEFARIKHRMGYHDGMVDGEPADWDDHRPQLEVHATDGTPIRTVAEDPDGEPQNLFGEEGIVQTPEERIAQLERILSAVQRQPGGLDSVLANLAAEPADAEVPEDTPAKGRRGPTPK